MRPWYRRPDNPIKRLFDLSLGFFGLLWTAPMFLVIAVLIKLEDGGPVFYIHPRIGKDGKPFPFFKFRTMKVDSDKSGFEIEAGDSRILRIGQFLRRWSIDEVPQLLNILRGEMSFIGPRPTLGYQVETYNPRQRGRLAVLPGVTGLAQVSGRNSLTWPQRIELDLKYIENYSLGLDVWIVLKTFGTVVNPDGIYGHGWEKKS